MTCHISPLPALFPSSSPTNVCVLLYNKLPLESLLIILAGVLLFWFHGCCSLFLSSVAFREQSAKSISWGSPGAWPSCFGNFHRQLQRGPDIYRHLILLQCWHRWGRGGPGTGCRVLTIAKGLHFTTEKVRGTHLAWKYLHEDQLPLGWISTFFWNCCCCFSSILSFSLIATLQSTYH